MTDPRHYRCPDCGELCGIGLTPYCPHGAPPWIKGTYVTKYEDDGEYIHRGKQWKHNPKT